MVRPGKAANSELSNDRCPAIGRKRRRSDSARWCAVALLAFAAAPVFATPCEDYPKPSLRYVGDAAGPVRYSVPYPISSLFVLDPAPAPEMKYFGLGVRTTTSETRFRVDGVTWTPQASNPSIRFTGLDVSGTLTNGNYGTSWSSATITFLPAPGGTSPIVKSTPIIDWTLIYQLVKPGLSTNPPSNDWACQWGIGGTSNASSQFFVGTDSVTVGPSTTQRLAMLVSGLRNGTPVQFEEYGPLPGPSLYIQPNLSDGPSGLGGNQAIVFPESGPPTLTSVRSWEALANVPSPVDIQVTLRAPPVVNLAFVSFAQSPFGVRVQKSASFQYLQEAVSREHLGISFAVTDDFDDSVQGAQAALSSYRFAAGGCPADLAQLSHVRAPLPGKITVYLVDQLVDENYNPLAGVACPNQKFIVLPTNSMPSTLVHEIGHVLSLRDEKGDALTIQNLMWASEAKESSRFTDGQVFRMHYSTLSFLAGSGGQPVIPCSRGPETVDPRCPPLATDVWGDTP